MLTTNLHGTACLQNSPVIVLLKIHKNSKRGISAQEEASQHILGNTKGQLISECLKFSKNTPQKFDKFLP